MCLYSFFRKSRARARCLALCALLAQPHFLRAQYASAISITKIFGYEQTAEATLVDYQPAVDILVSYRNNVPSDWKMDLSAGPTIYTLTRGPVAVDTASFFGGKTYASVNELNTTLANGTYNLFTSFGSSGYSNAQISVAFDATLPSVRFLDFAALQKWDGEPRTVSWQSPTGTTRDETRVFTLERSDGTVVFDTRTDGIPLYDGSTFVELPSVTSRAGEVFYATLTYSRQRSSSAVGSLSVILNQAFRVRIAIRRPPPPPPVILVQPVSRSASVAGSVTFAVEASGESLSYRWSKDGTPLTGATSSALTLAGLQTTQAGSYRVAVTNPGGTVTSNSATLTLTPQSSAPSYCTISPTSLSLPVGNRAVFFVNHDGTPPFNYQWFRDGAPLTAPNDAILNLANVTLGDAGDYSVAVSNSLGTRTSSVGRLSVRYVAPTITTSPAPFSVIAGAKTTLAVTAAGTAPLTYQWSRNGTVISGATTATLTLDPTLPSDAASYSVRITNSAGSVTSSAATLTVTPITRISNISVLTSLADLTDNFTLGYVVGGNTTTGPKPLLLRAAGPALAALGVAGTLDDPKLELFAGSTKTAENDNWAPTASIASTLTAAFTSVGAFPFPSPTSKDAATTANLTTRDNSVKISAASTATTTGLVLAEIYDATPTDTFTTATPRLLNVSVLKSLGTGLTVGFTIAGSVPKAVLLRAVGPTLASFGISGAVADPQLTLYQAGRSAPLASNDNWFVPIGSAPDRAALTAAFSSVGAFALPADSRDAALLITLPSGGYSVQVTGVAATSGTALVEVYEVP